LAAIVAGVKAADIIEVLNKAPEALRDKVKEVTMDMSSTMEAIIRKSFPKVTIVTDRFHVQQTGNRSGAGDQD
jgi:transposase